MSEPQKFLTHCIRCSAIMYEKLGQTDLWSCNNCGFQIQKNAGEFKQPLCREQAASLIYQIRRIADLAEHIFKTISEIDADDTPQPKIPDLPKPAIRTRGPNRKIPGSVP